MKEDNLNKSKKAEKYGSEGAKKLANKSSLFPCYYEIEHDCMNYCVGDHANKRIWAAVNIRLAARFPVTEDCFPGNCLSHDE